MHIALWVLSGLIALEMLAAGSRKVRGGPAVAANAAHLGYPVAFLRFIGVAELAGAAGILLPWTRLAAAIAFLPLMVGAAVSHVRAGDPWTKAIPAVVTITVLVVVVWGSIV